MDALDFLNSVSFNAEKDKYSFKRKFYFKCLDFINNDDRQCCIISGPRRIGKTVCLLQLLNNIPNAKYYNFKTVSSNSDLSDEVYDEIVSDSENTIYLLDEFTYIDCGDVWLSKLANYFEMHNSNVKIIITGNQVQTLNYYGGRAFATNACYIYTSFLDFEEWLVYKNKTEYDCEYACTESDYKEFLMDSYTFTGIKSNEEYLKVCIDETITSELKSLRAVRGMQVMEDGEANKVVTLLYAVLLSLHDKLKYNKLRDHVSLLTKVYTFMNNKDIISRQEFNQACNDVFITQLERLSRIRIHDIQRYLNFLVQCDMITISVNTNDIDECMVIENWFSRSDYTHYDYFRNIHEFFDKCNIMIKHPVFYINILRELCEKLDGIELEDLLSQPILGSIVECQVKGLICYKLKTNELREFYGEFDGKEREVDYFNDWLKSAIEISVRDKDLKDLNFEYLPDYQEYKLICLSKNKEGLRGKGDLYQVEFIPYYKYIYENSKGYFVHRR